MEGQRAFLIGDTWSGAEVPEGQKWPGAQGMGCTAALPVLGRQAMPAGHGAQSALLEALVAVLKEPAGHGTACGSVDPSGQ